MEDGSYCNDEQGAQSRVVMSKDIYTLGRSYGKTMRIELVRSNTLGGQSFDCSSPLLVMFRVRCNGDGDEDEVTGEGGLGTITINHQAVEVR